MEGSATAFAFADAIVPPSSPRLAIFGPLRPTLAVSAGLTPARFFRIASIYYGLLSRAVEIVAQPGSIPSASSTFRADGRVSARPGVASTMSATSPSAAHERVIRWAR